MKLHETIYRPKRMGETCVTHLQIICVSSRLEISEKTDHSVRELIIICIEESMNSLECIKEQRYLGH